MAGLKGALDALACTPTRNIAKRDSGDPSKRAGKTPQIVRKQGELDGLDWPSSFVAEPRGDHIVLSEDGAVATRESGTGRGVCLVGPLHSERKGKFYFEVEILDLDGGGLQTMAVGICNSLPPANSNKRLMAERAKDLGQGVSLIGYELPKFFVNGAEISKVDVKAWRPLKELSLHDRVGVLFERTKLTVFVNGTTKISFAMPAVGDGQSRLPNEVWGVVDVHGTVRSVKLVNSKKASALKASALSSLDFSPAPSVAKGTPHLSSKEKEENLPEDPKEVSGENKTQIGKKRKAEAPCDYPTKKFKQETHNCGCPVHLICHTGSIVHVPESEFVIGRREKEVSLQLECKSMPKMISRKNSRIVTTDEGVEVHDCNSRNGTWVNGARVERSVLKHGDKVVIGPVDAPAVCRFTVWLPQP